MKLFRLVLKFSLLAGASLLILVFFFWNTSPLIGDDLNDGGNAYYDYSPDERYKAMSVFFNDERPFQLILNEEEDVIYVAKFGNTDVSLGITVWGNTDDRLAPTYNYVRMSYDNIIALPVPFYERWYAWLFMNVRNVDLDKLKMIPD